MKPVVHEPVCVTKREPDFVCCECGRLFRIEDECGLYDVPICWYCNESERLTEYPDS